LLRWGVGLEVVPFATGHLDAGAALLAVRQRRDRCREPDLPARFEETATARALLEEIVDWSAASGVVALRRGRPVGYLVGAPLLTPQASRQSFFLPSRAGYVPFAGHAVDADEDATEVYGALYAALSAGWVARGYLSHHVQVAVADRAALEAWHALGFGDELVTALRDTSPLHGGSVAADVRRAVPEDLEVVTRLVLALYRHHTGPPVYLPYSPEAEAHEREHQRRLLADPACSHWIARRDGRALGMVSLQPPSPLTPPMIVPPACIYLLDAYVDPAARGTGLGAALLAEGLDWARAAGHRHCLLQHHAANLVARRFWHQAGFRPIKRRLCRRIDERMAPDRRDG
jgi:GNAT superfamily N-acetyltransferase